MGEMATFASLFAGFGLADIGAMMAGCWLTRKRSQDGLIDILIIRLYNGRDDQFSSIESQLKKECDRRTD